MRALGVIAALAIAGCNSINIYVGNDTRAPAHYRISWEGVRIPEAEYVGTVQPGEEDIITIDADKDGERVAWRAEFVIGDYKTDNIFGPCTLKFPDSIRLTARYDDVWFENMYLLQVNTETAECHTHGRIVINDTL